MPLRGCFYSLAAAGFYCLIFGMGGKFAFSQTFMMALGAYVSSKVSTLQSHWIVALMAAALVDALLAFVVGMGLKRAPAFSFAIATLALAQIGYTVFQQWQWLAGEDGTVVNIGPPVLFGYAFETPRSLYFLLGGFLFVAVVIATLLERSPVRREALAARTNPIVAKGLGVAVDRLQLGLYVLGSTIGGISGALFAHTESFISIDSSLRRSQSESS